MGAFVKYKVRWDRFALLVFVVVGLATTLFSCQMAEASEDLPIPLPVQTIIGECASCSVDGMIAVGNVIRNRARLRGQTFDEVVLAPKQFSCWNDGKARMARFVEANASVIDTAWAAWQASATGDITGGADLYHADYVKPDWDWSKTVRTVKIGKHIYYREIR